MYVTFCNSIGSYPPFPASVDNLLKFINHSHFSMGHCANTTKSLISMLKQLHDFNYGNTQQFDNIIVKRVLLGIRNKESINPRPIIPRLAFNFSSLMKLGHIISQLPWPPEDRSSIWSAYLMAFWGSFRLGEIVSKTANKPSFHTLMWGWVQKLAGQPGLIVHVLAPKKESNAISVPLVPYSDSRYCPVYWLEKIRPHSCERNSYVYRFKSGKLITSKIMSNLLKKMSSDLGTSGKFTGHSLRAALPSLLASHPKSFSVREIKTSGRWHSDTYEVYCRSKAVGSKETASKVHQIFDHEQSEF